MIKKIINKIREKKRSKKIFWRVLFFIKNLIWNLYDTQPKNPLKTEKIIGEYDHLFRTRYANQKNEYLEYIEPVLKKIKNKKPAARILEVGCGIGYLLNQLNDIGFKVSGIDFSKEAVDNQINKNLDVVCGNSKKLPWKSAYFDFVCSMGALEHYTYNIFDLLETFKEIYRILKPGGIFVFFVPCFDNSTNWGAVYKSGYHRKAEQYELGWSSEMWTRCVNNLFDLKVESVKKIKFDWMHKDYMYINVTCRKTK